MDEAWTRNKGWGDVGVVDNGIETAAVLPGGNTVGEWSGHGLPLRNKRVPINRYNGDCMSWEVARIREAQQANSINLDRFTNNHSHYQKSR